MFSSDIENISKIKFLFKALVQSVTELIQKFPMYILGLWKKGEKEGSCRLLIFET